MRRAIEPLLTRGCPLDRPAPTVLHEEFHGLNADGPWQLLLEDALEHSTSAYKYTRDAVGDFKNGTLARNPKFAYELRVFKGKLRHRTYMNGWR